MAEASFEETYGVASSGNRTISTDNSILWNAGLSPVPSYNFMLRVEGIIDLPCKAVRAFSKQVEFELIQEGGLNDYVHMRRKPISNPFYFEVERYIGVDYIDPLPLGAELLLPVLLMVSRNAGDFGAAARVYTFTGCTVTKKEYGQMDADRSGLFVETTTIAYRELLCVDSPLSEKISVDPIDQNPKRSQMQAKAESAAKDARKEAEAANDKAKQEENERLAAREAQRQKDEKALTDLTSDEAEKKRQQEEEAREQAREAQRQKDEQTLTDLTSDEAEEKRQQEEEAREQAREAQRQKDEQAREALLDAIEENQNASTQPNEER